MRNGNKRREKPQDQESIKGNLVQATNILETPVIEQGEAEDTVVAPIACVQHISLNVGDLWRDAMQNHLGNIRLVIKKKASLYYSELSPTTLTDIVHELQNIVVDSFEVFAIICSAWKYQNCLQFEDEDGFDLKPLFNNIKNCVNLVDQYNSEDAIMDFAISNSNWKKDVLSVLKDIYVHPNTMEILYTFCGHFIQLDSAADGHDRYFTFDVSDFRRDDGDIGKDYATFKARIDALVADIDEAYNKYPFMDEVCRTLGLINPGTHYDFTRDLSQSKLKVMKDQGKACEDMLYCICQRANVGDTILESDTTMFRVVRKAYDDGSYLTFYKDDASSADKLNYQDRVWCDIKSLTNALRGNVTVLNNTLFFVEKNTNTKTYAVENPFVLNLQTNAVLVNVNTAIQVLRRNRDNAIYDMPNDAVVLVITATDGSSAITSGIFKPMPSSGDYLISTDDIESVISDATYELLLHSFNPSEPADSQTLGNAGQNNSTN